MVWLLGDYQPPTRQEVRLCFLTVIMPTVMNIIVSAVMIKNIESRPGIWRTIWRILEAMSG